MRFVKKKNVKRRIDITLAAPKSLKIVPQNGTGARPPSSRTRTPFNGVVLFIARVDSNRLMLLLLFVVVGGGDCVSPKYAMLCNGVIDSSS